MCTQTLGSSVSGMTHASPGTLAIT
ncbi:hypothetical protein E2C01_075773 [Portunus trituberculatus]|uniref:Uncharacterized protein n=1 Tax=Portunus trituberculatus TaxID=210409 RepID=A0A5B7IHY4_PORTR|nr:hypothetical protein [Portunus trituberculatus]